MTTKELAHSIIDSFTEKQLKGFVNLFVESEPDVDDRDINAVIADIAWEYAVSCNDPQYLKRIDDHITYYLEKGKQVFYARLYAYYSVLAETTEAFKYMRRMLNKGKSYEMIAENIEVSLKEVEKMAELLRAEKLVDNGV